MNNTDRILLEYKYTIKHIELVIEELQVCAERLLDEDIGIFEPVQLLGNVEVLKMEAKRAKALIDNLRLINNE